MSDRQKASILILMVAPVRVVYWLVLLGNENTIVALKKPVTKTDGRSIILFCQKNQVVKVTKTYEM